MNRYPLWKNLLIGLVLIFGFIYTLPNFYGEVPAVQVSSGKATLKLEPAQIEARVAEILSAAKLPHTGIFSDTNSVRARFETTDLQLQGKDAIERGLNPNAADPSYVVALNLLSASPHWLTAIGALPMYLGLDLRGGVHFLLEVDMDGALVKRMDATA
ncbi:MAG TPA: protein translocase subunit SecD, partial [Denitromonas sp.]|nr:protein translocase subunit SecD [Denitromonas sp.]